MPRWSPSTPFWPLLALLLALPGTLAGQATGSGPGGASTYERPSSGGVEISLSGTALTPLALLTENPGSFATEVSTGVGVSGTLGYWLGSGFGLTAHGAWVPAELDLQQSTFTGPIPDELGDADYLVGSVSLVYRVRPRGPAAIVEPFVGLGAGIRDLSVDPQASPDAEDAADLAGTVMGGTYAHLGTRTSLRLEIRDVVSRYESPRSGESRLQNDLLVSIGVSYRP